MPKISELIDSVRSQDLVLPEFQREYVWGRDQAKQLMISLHKEYPVGSLLFWKTTDPPELKNRSRPPDSLGSVQLILDGQQRLTTLYLLLTGDIPPYYREADIKNDPRDLYYHLGTGEFFFYQKTRMEGDRLWYPVVELFSDEKVKVFELAKSKTDLPEEVTALAELYSENLASLMDIPKQHLPVQIVPTHASLEDAIDIFDRVNSLGTKLTDADLALTHVTAKWPTARRELKKKIEEASSRRFYFDLNFMTRGLVTVVTRRALFETIHQVPRDELVRGWKELAKILDYLTALLPEKAHIHSTEDVNTTNVFIPLVTFLAQNGGSFDSEKTVRHAIYWLYAASTWARYTAQTDQRLEHDVTLIAREESPWGSLCEQIIDQRGRIEVKPPDLEGRGAQHPLYRITFILCKAHGAVDWFNGTPLSATHGKTYKINSHHIFPQSLLYKEIFDVNSHLDRKKVNEVANRAFLTADTNVALSDERPEAYLPEVEEKFPTALESQFIPLDRDLWRTERYADFLAARRDLIAKRFNALMNSLVKETESERKKPLVELIKVGESTSLEFKSSLQWDLRKQEQNKALRHAVIKNIGAFLNTEGGTLLLGVEDDGTVLGLEKDLQIFKGSRDKFAQLLSSLISEQLGPEYAKWITVDFEAIEEKEVCVIEVEKAPEPVFVRTPTGKELFIRVATTTRSLDPQQAHTYIQHNWE